MDQFEYKTIFTDAKGFFGGKIDQGFMDRQLNQLGDQGWELVSTFASNQSYGSTRWIVSVFKRKK
jgi:hypothetical protein